MEHGEHLKSLPELAIIALVALGCGIVVARFRQPALVGYIFAGVLLGPSGFGLAQDEEMIRLTAELGVLLLLFVIGMELSVRAIREVWQIALLTTGAQITAALGVMYGFGQLLGWRLETVLILGFVVAISSTAVAVKMLDEIGELRTRVGQVTVGVLIAQDLAVVPMMLIVESLGDGHGIDHTAMAKVAASIALMALLVFLLSGRETLRLPFSRVVSRIPDLAPLAGLAFCFGAAALSGFLGLSAAYGAFLSGLILGNSTSRGEMLQHLLPIQSVLVMMFFLSIGLLIDLDFLWAHFWEVLAILVCLTLFKTALNVLVLRASGEPWPRAILAGVVLAEIGEFSFILAALGLATGALLEERYRLIITVTALSLVVAPFWLAWARNLHRIVVLGVTSGRETFRLTFGSFRQTTIRGSRRHRSDMMVGMASNATRWVGDITPRRRGDRPGQGPPMPR